MLQVFAIGPYQHQLQIRVPFDNIVKHITEAPSASLEGECGRHLAIRHGTIPLHLHTRPRKDVLRGHFGGMNHRCPPSGIPHCQSTPLYAAQCRKCIVIVGASPHGGLVLFGSPAMSPKLMSPSKSTLDEHFDYEILTWCLVWLTNHVQDHRWVPLGVS